MGQRQAKLDEVTKGLSRAEARARQLETEKSKIQKVLQEVNRSRQGLQEELSQKCATDFLDKVTMDDLMAENATLTHRVTGLEDELSRTVAAKNSMEMELQRKDTRIDCLSSQLSASKEQCKGLQAQTTSLLEELDRVGRAMGFGDAQRVAPARQEGPPILAQDGSFVGF